MSMSPDAIQLAGLAYESVLGLVGLWLLWSLALCPAARARAGPNRLTAWDISIWEFLFFLWLAICGGLLLPIAVRPLLNQLSLSADNRLVVTGAVFQLGLLAGVGVFYWRSGRAAETPALPAANPWLAGAGTFLISLPLLNGVSFLWLNLLDWWGYPLEPQPLVDLLGRPGPPLQHIFFGLFAVVIAPVTEELLFRAGIFRFLRTRIPRWGALILSAELFAAMHADLPSFAPLLALGLVFSLAYERTGRITTTMVAHGLFNLNTMVLILAGLDG